MEIITTNFNDRKIGQADVNFVQGTLTVVRFKFTELGHWKRMSDKRGRDYCYQTKGSFSHAIALPLNFVLTRKKRR